MAGLTTAMAQLLSVLHRLLLAAPLGALAAAPAWAAEPVPAPMAPPSSAVLQPVPGVEVQYDQLAPAGNGAPGPARLQGSVDTGEGQLRSSVRIDPGERRVGTLDTSLELHAPGPLKTVVVGDTYASGAGWSQPARLTGLRFGRALALRAPRSAADPLKPLGFVSTPQGLDESSGSTLLDAKRLLPKPAAPSVPVPGGPTSLDAGASDYAVELGKLRNGWDTPERTYQADYAAAAYRAGLGHGLTAEARSEWSEARNAHGVEVLQDVGAGAKLQAVVAQSAGSGETGGVRWGMGVVRNAEGATWSLAYDAAERGFTGVTGAAEPREGVRAGASVALGPRTSAEVSYLRQQAWDAPAADVALNLATNVALAQRMKLSLNVGRREGAQAGWQAGMALTVPLDTPARAR